MNKIEVRTRDFSPDLIDEWNTLILKNNRDDFYISPEWFHSILHLCSAPLKKPTFICVYNNNILIGLLPVSLSTSIKKKVFRFNTLTLLGNLYSARKGGVFDKDYTNIIAREISSFVNKGGMGLIDEIYLDAIDKDDLAFIESFQIELQKYGFIGTKASDFENIHLDVTNYSGSNDFFNSMSKKNRQNIRTAINRCKKKNLNLIVVTNEATEPNDLMSLIDDYYKVYGQSWKDEELDTNFHRRLVDYLTTSRFNVKVYNLYQAEDIESHSIDSIDSNILTSKPKVPKLVPIASTLFVTNDEQSFFLKTIYDDAYADYSLGTINLWFSLRDLMDKHNVSHFDFQRGGESYKKRFGNDFRKRYKFNFFNKSRLRVLAYLFIIKIVYALRAENLKTQ